MVGGRTRRGRTIGGRTRRGRTIGGIRSLRGANRRVGMTMSGSTLTRTAIRGRYLKTH